MSRKMNVDELTRKLSDSFIEYKISGKIIWDSPILLAVISVTEVIEKRYGKQLEILADIDLEKFVCFLDGMFDDGKINWTRILMVYLMGAIVTERKAEYDIQCMKRCIGEYVAVRLGDWIESQGGWVSCVCYN